MTDTKARATENHRRRFILTGMSTKTNRRHLRPLIRLRRFAARVTINGLGRFVGEVLSLMFLDDS